MGLKEKARETFTQIYRWNHKNNKSIPLIVSTRYFKYISYYCVLHLKMCTLKPLFFTIYYLIYYLPRFIEKLIKMSNSYRKKKPDTNSLHYISEFKQVPLYKKNYIHFYFFKISEMRFYDHIGKTENDFTIAKVLSCSYIKLLTI